MSIEHIKLQRLSDQLRYLGAAASRMAATTNLQQDLESLEREVADALGFAMQITGVMGSRQRVVLEKEL